MADPNTNRSNYDDPATMLLLLALFVTAFFALTLIGLVGIAITVAIYKVSGRPNWLLGCMGAWGLILAAGSWAGAATDLWIAYRYVLRQFVDTGLDPSVLLRDWLELLRLPAAWLLLLPAGGLIGAALSLTEHDGNQSQLSALMQGKPVPSLKPAPLASWFQKRINAKPARSGDSIVLGGDWRTGQAITISDRDLNKHLLVAGTTGAGKTVGLLNLIEGSPEIGTVIVDGKGDIKLARRVIALAQARGQRAYLFDGTRSEKGSVYNPLASGDFTSLADRIVTLREWSEEYYLSLAKGFAQAAFHVLQECGSRVDLISAEKYLTTRELTGLVRGSGKTGRKYKKLVDEIHAQKAADEHVEGLRSDIRNLANSVLGPLFDTARAMQEKIPVIDIRRAREENALVYFCLPAPEYPKFASMLGKLIVNDIKANMVTSHSPWRIILDEFSVFAGPQVLNVINMGRGYGISAVLATQSLADIAQGGERNGEKFLDQVIGSINTFIIYRLNSPNDCELASGLAGTFEQVEFTAQTVNGTGTGAASARHARTYRIHPDTVKNISIGEAIYINKNMSNQGHLNCCRFKARLNLV